MIAQNDSFLSAALQSMYESNADEITRQKCRAREEYCKLERALEETTDEVAALNRQLAERDSVIAEKDSVIAELKKQLAEAQK